jgi:hypothetical protein
MEEEDDALLLTFFFGLRVILDPSASYEAKRKEVFHIQFVHQQWMSIYPNTPDLSQISCLAPVDEPINTTAWTLATKLHAALIAAADETNDG